MLKKFQEMGKLLKQAQEMKNVMKEIQQEMKRSSFAVDVSNGKIKIVIDGELNIKSIEIAEDILKKEHKADIQRALVKGVNDAITKAKNAATERLSKISGDMMPSDALPE